jgi:rhamnulokinase
VSSPRFAAVDLGASSGRVLVGTVSDGRMELHEVHRFRNGGIDVLGHLYWDVLGIYRGVLDGLARAAETGPLCSIGIDSWGVDYGLLDGRGELLGNPYHHRDHRTDGVGETTVERLGAAWLYRRTGIATLPFNTVFQLLAEGDRLGAARCLLLMPDLIGHWLTGARVAEVTNASTTGLLAVPERAGSPGWDEEVLQRLGLPRRILPPLVRPGTPLGGLLAAPAEATGTAAGTPVVAVGSHDTASAVLGVPAGPGPFAFLSSGTWSLLGAELDTPVRTEAARLAGFTNELGVDGTTRFLRNVMGLWLLQECQRAWRNDDLTALLRAASAEPPRRFLIDVDDPALLAPGGMPARIAAACAGRGGPVPATPAEVTRCILDSLAVAYRRTLEDLVALSGRSVEVLHVVGGGVRNPLLCQLTADACAIPVVAGPSEAAAAGNLLVQARAAGVVEGDRTALRRLVRDGQTLRRFEPSGPEAPWADAAAELRAEREPLCQDGSRCASR